LSLITELNGGLFLYIDHYCKYFTIVHVSHITPPSIFSYQRKLIGAILRLNKVTLTVIKNLILYVVNIKPEMVD